MPLNIIQCDCRGDQSYEVIPRAARLWLAELQCFMFGSAVEVQSYCQVNELQ